MPNKNSKKNQNSKKKNKPKKQKNEQTKARTENSAAGISQKIDLESLNEAIDINSREMVEIREIEGKGRGMIAKNDISLGTEILKDTPLAASIYGIEIMPIKYHFKPSGLIELV